MKDFLLLIYIIVLCFSVVNITITQVLNVKFKSRMAVLFIILIGLFSLIYLNGIFDYYSYTISNGHHFLFLNWYYFIFNVIQVILNWFLLKQSYLFFYKNPRAVVQTGISLYFVLSLFLVFFYILMIAAGPLLGRHNSFIRYLMNFSAFQQKFMSFIFYFTVIMTQVCYGLFCLILFLNLKKLDNSYQKTIVKTYLVLFLTFIPVWLVGHLYTYSPFHPLNPMNISTVFIFLMNLFYAYFIKSHYLNLYQYQLPEQIPQHFIDRYKITSRECQIAMLLIQGKAYKEMAYELELSLSTIKNHIQNVYEKTNCRSRMEIIQLISHSIR